MPGSSCIISYPSLRISHFFNYIFIFINNFSFFNNFYSINKHEFPVSIKKRWEAHTKKKKFRRYRFLREGRKKVLHIFLSLKFPEGESHFWTARGGNPSAGESHHPDPFRASLEWVLPLQKKPCSLFLAGKNIASSIAKRGHYLAHTCLEMVQILVVTRRRMKRAQGRCLKMEISTSPSKYQNTLWEVPVYVKWPVDFSGKQYQVKRTDFHFLETQKYADGTTLQRRGPSKLHAPEGTNKWIEEIRPRKTGWSFRSDSSQRLFPPESPPWSIEWPSGASLSP